MARSTTTATPENAAAESAKSVLDLTDLSTEERFEIELQWCIEQIELGLQKKKPNPKQAQESMRVLKILNSSKAPMVQKRQVMHMTCKDYKSKLKLDQQFLKRYLNTGDVKPVKKEDQHGTFYKKAQSSRSKTTQCDDNKQFRFNFCVESLESENQTTSVNQFTTT
ncbi:UPF0488 protein C8orf33 homolog isoform X2 [Corticium candelabrum]|uniref:UPF0488 protein C8orf33 homolog isoform X2 n=1 Tax=Corticium candelabrum TaxID=121492 RepID=UPI002E27747D|nr:UPF0488 protein C8orf33 homolog isoform X2 [Corticium candelabrum]